VPFTYEPRWEHGGEDDLKPDKGKGPETPKPKEPIFNFPGSSRTHEYEPGPQDHLNAGDNRERSEEETEEHTN
jgi:hypothetical protein